MQNKDIFEITNDFIEITGFTTKNATNETGFNIQTNVNNLKIENNIIENNTNGIELHTTDNNQIKNNTIQNNTSNGIWLSSSNHNQIENNKIKNNKIQGINLNAESNNNTIENNQIQNTGPWPSGAGIKLSNSSKNTIRKNKIKDGSGHGVWLAVGSDNNTVFNNRVGGNNNIGVQISDSDNNIVFNNFIFNNSTNGYDNRNNSWENDKKGNWWGDWQPSENSQDSDSDGIIDDPYPLEGGTNYDNFPQALVTLETPEDKIVLKENDPNLTWRTPILHHYQLNVSDGSNLIENTSTTDDNYKLDGENDGTYYWKISGETEENDYQSPWTFPREFTIDNTFPKNLNLVSPENNEITKDNVLFSWTEVTEANFENYELWINDNLEYSTTTKSDTSVVRYLENGVYEWYVVAYDNVGHENKLENRIVRVDNLPPRNLNISSPADGTVSDDSVNFSWTEVTESNFENYELWINDNLEYSTTTKSDTSVVRYLENGVYEWYVVAYDNVGHENQTNTRTLRVDNIPPENLTTISPENNEITKSEVLFSWSEVIEANFKRYELWIDDSLKYSTTNKTKTSRIVYLENGKHHWEVRAYDKAGHENRTENITFYVDNIFPKGLNLKTPENGYISDDNVYFSWTEVTESNFDNALLESCVIALLFRLRETVEKVGRVLVGIFSV